MHKVGFKPSIMTYTASTSSRRAGGSLTPAPPGGLRRGCADTSGATPLRPASGPTPPTFWRVPGAGRWRSHGRRSCTEPTGRPTPRRPPPRGRGSLPTCRPGGTSSATRSTSLPAPRRPADTAPSPAAEAQAQSQDMGRGERRRSQLSEDVSCSNSVAVVDCEER